MDYLLFSKLLLFLILSISIEGSFLKRIEENVDFYVKLIEKAIEALPKLNHKSNNNNNFFFQEVNLVDGFTQYKWSKTGEIGFTRNTLDNHLSYLIFPTGKYFGPKVNGTYTVLLRSSLSSKYGTIYYLNGVYIRNDGTEESIEWTPEELWEVKKSKIEYDMCQGIHCSIQHILTGTCSIAKRKCTKSSFSSNFQYDPFLKKEKNISKLTEQLRVLDKRDSHTSSTMDELDSSTKNGATTRKKRMMMYYDYYNAYTSYLRSSTREKKTNWTLKELRVPSSFDLLEMMEQSTENGTDFVFKNRIDRKRKKRKSHKIYGGIENVVDSNVQVENLLDTFTCYDCHKLGIGNYFFDVEEDTVYSQVFGFGIKRMIQNHEIEMSESENIKYKKYKSIQFIGYGNCPYDMNGRQKPISTDLDDIIDFYLNVLKINCDIYKDLIENVRSWFTGEIKILKIQPDMTVSISSTCPFLKYKILSTIEYETLFSSLLFSKFTSVYMEESLLNLPKDEFHFHPYPTNFTISKEIKFLSHVFLESLESVRLYLSHHLIKLTRSLARLLKNKFIALLTEMGRGVGGGGVDKRIKTEETSLRQLSLSLNTNFENAPNSEGHNTHEMNYNDRQQIMALKEFILFGLRPILTSTIKTQNAFYSFYNLNANRIKFLVDIYDINLDD